MTTTSRPFLSFPSLANPLEFMSFFTRLVYGEGYFDRLESENFNKHWRNIQSYITASLKDLIGDTPLAEWVEGANVALADALSQDETLKLKLDSLTINISTKDLKYSWNITLRYRGKELVLTDQESRAYVKRDFSGMGLVSPLESLGWLNLFLIFSLVLYVLPGNNLIAISFFLGTLIFPILNFISYFCRKAFDRVEEFLTWEHEHDLSRESKLFFEYDIKPLSKISRLLVFPFRMLHHLLIAPPIIFSASLAVLKAPHEELSKFDKAKAYATLFLSVLLQIVLVTLLLPIYLMLFSKRITDSISSAYSLLWQTYAMPKDNISKSLPKLPTEVLEPIALDESEHLLEMKNAKGVQSLDLKNYQEDLASLLKRLFIWATFRKESRILEGHRKETPMSNMNFPMLKHKSHSRESKKVHVKVEHIAGDETNLSRSTHYGALHSRSKWLILPATFLVSFTFVFTLFQLFAAGSNWFVSKELFSGVIAASIYMSVSVLAGLYYLWARYIEISEISAEVSNVENNNQKLIIQFGSKLGALNLLKAKIAALNLQVVRSINIINSKIKASGLPESALIQKSDYLSDINFQDVMGKWFYADVRNRMDPVHFERTDMRLRFKRLCYVGAVILPLFFASMDLFSGVFLPDLIAFSGILLVVSVVGYFLRKRKDFKFISKTFKDAMLLCTGVQSGIIMARIFVFPAVPEALPFSPISLALHWVIGICVVAGIIWGALRYYEHHANKEINEAHNFYKTIHERAYAADKQIELSTGKKDLLERQAKQLRKIAVSLEESSTLPSYIEPVNPCDARRTIQAGNPQDPSSKSNFWLTKDKYEDTFQLDNGEKPEILFTGFDQDECSWMFFQIDGSEKYAVFPMSRLELEKDSSVLSFRGKEYRVSVDADRLVLTLKGQHPKVSFFPASPTSTASTSSTTISPSLSSSLSSLSSSDGSDALSPKRAFDTPPQSLVLSAEY